MISLFPYITTAHQRTAWTLLAGFMVLWLGGIVANAQTDPANADLVATAQAQGSVRVIVTLDGDFAPEATLAPAAAEAQREQIAAAQFVFETTLADANVTITDRYTTVPQLALEADADALTQLQGLPQVASVVADEQLVLFLSSSIPAINADQAHQVGMTGAGWSVAVLDTGVQNNHPWFLNGVTTRVIAEACFNTVSAAYGSSSRCANGESQMIGTNAAADDCAACGHGTHIAGIVAGRDPAGVHIGVAPDATVIGVNVFSQMEDGEVRAWTSDVNAALEYVYTLRDTHQIAAVNLSAGVGAYTDTCDTNPMTPFIDNLAAAGITTVAATGNDGSSTHISAPACISSVVAVGSTTDSDSVSYFTNVNALVDLYAPGSAITSAAANASVTTLQGTSNAAPHVAGAWAILKQRNPELDPETTLTTLISTGRQIGDRGQVVPRLDVEAALNAIPTACPVDRVGFFTAESASWSLLAANRADTDSVTFAYGDPSDIPLVGDWDGDGIDTVGVRRGLRVLLRNSNSAGEFELDFEFGTSGDVIVFGDWNGDGVDTVGLYRPTTADWLLRNSNSAGPPDITLNHGIPLEDVPLVGDWDGDGIDTVGLHRPTSGTWVLRNRNAADVPDITFSYGSALQDRAIVGDWNGDCVDSPGVYRRDESSWFLRNTVDSGVADIAFAFGSPNLVPLVGAW